MWRRSALGIVLSFGLGVATIAGWVSLGLVSSAGAAEAQAVRSGEMSYEVAGGPNLSYLGIDISQLEGSLCATQGGVTRDPKLVVANDGGNSSATRVFGLDVSGATELPGGTMLTVDVHPASLSLVSPAPLPTVCGSWSYRLQLDGGKPSPSSTLTLVRNLASDVAGAFTGAVEVDAAIEFVPLAGGPSQWRFYTLSLDLAGTWGLAPTTPKGLGLPASASNLVLFVQRSGASWSKSAQSIPQHSLDDPNSGQLVLQPTDTAIGWLSPSGRR